MQTIRFLLILTLCMGGCERAPDGGGQPIVSLHTELGGDAGAYTRVCESREFVFPKDHGAHPAYRNEWWYLTGNLSSEQGVDIGFHVTFFRIANVPDRVDSQSSWSASQFYMGHFALSIDGQPQVIAHERFARAAAGLAGVKQVGANTKVWLDSWTLENTDDGVWQVSLAEGDEQLSLTLTAQKPVVLQGDSGYSRKGADPCNSSYYYSLSRLHASGTVSTADGNHHVTGMAWFDRSGAAVH